MKKPKIISEKEIAQATPWEIKLSEEIDPDAYDGTTQKDIVGQAYKDSEIDNSLSDNLDSTLLTLKSVITDVAAGDIEAMKRPEFACLNWNAIRAAVKWLNETDSLSNTAKVDLATNAWRLNFKCRPPTPEEFLTPKFIGPTAESIYEPVKKAFLESMDFNKPYRTTVLSCCIGWGKSLLTVLTNLFISVHYAMMWHPYRFFGQSASTVYTQVLCGWNQKKASELLLEPFMNILETSPYFVKSRTHGELIDQSNDNDIDKYIYWTTATKTAQPLDSKIYLPDGSYKLMGDIKVGDIIASPTKGEVEVISIPYHGVDMCYEIELEDGRKTQCNAEHLWKVSWKKDKDGNEIWEVVTTQFMIDHPELEFSIIDLDDCKQNIENN